MSSFSCKKHTLQQRMTFSALAVVLCSIWFPEQDKHWVPCKMLLQRLLHSEQVTVLWKTTNTSSYLKRMNTVHLSCEIKSGCMWPLNSNEFDISADRGSTKSLRFILWWSWLSDAHFIKIHPKVVKNISLWIIYVSFMAALKQKSQKSEDHQSNLRSNCWGPWISAENFMPIHPIVVEILWPKWWTNGLISPGPHY